MTQAQSYPSNLVITTPEHLRLLIDDAITNAINRTLPIQDSNPEDGTPDLLTRHQTAQLLGICLATLDNWVREGRLTKYRNGRVVRFKKSEVLNSFQSLTKYNRSGL